MKPIPFLSCRRVALAFFLCCFLVLPAADLDAESVEGLLERSEPEANGDELLDVLQELRRHPVRIATASERELLEIPLLSAADAALIVARRNAGAPVGSADELAALIGADNAGRVAPYLSFAPPEPRRRVPAGAAGQSAGAGQAVSGSLSGRYYRELPPRKGIETGKYAGPNRALYDRVEVSGPDWGVSLLQESDIGEPDAGDFRSFSVHAERLGPVSRAVAGNYRVGFGQGLLLGQGRYFSKGTDAVDGVLTYASSLRPYTSSAEESFMQGGAAAIAAGPFEMTGFVSRGRLDATVTDGVATSTSATGYHRTAAEQARKDALGLDAEGLHLRWRYQADGLDAQVGGTVMTYRYGMPVSWLAGADAARQARSLDAGMVWRSVQGFGEIAFSEAPDAMSWIFGLQAQIAPGVTGVVSVRQYGRAYFSPFAGAFAERGTDGSDEEGYYLGISAKISRSLQVGASYDIFRFPELDSSLPLPSTGHDARLYVTWKPAPGLEWNGLYQHRQRESSESGTEDGGWMQYAVPVLKTTNRVQLGLDAKASRVVLFTTKGEYRSVGQGGATTGGEQVEHGWLWFGQTRATFGSLSAVTRVTCFDTDSYDSAVYAYEPDLPSVYSLGMYYGNGQALFVMLDWRPMGNLHLAGKYEIVWYGDRNTVGSGNDLRATSCPGAFRLGCQVLF